MIYCMKDFVSCLEAKDLVVQTVTLGYRMNFGLSFLGHHDPVLYENKVTVLPGVSFIAITYYFMEKT